MAHDWLHGGQALVVRYEDLKRDPVSALGALTDRIAPVSPDRIERAVEACSADKMRQMSASMAKHVRTATVGDSRNHLTEEHLALFRERYAEMIRGLGYEVR
jgi:hypothetical protein